MRILIAEDEERARRGLRSVLTSLSEDYEVVAEASNGKQALELLQILKPDVVFTDLKMPFLDGMGLIKAGIAAGACTKYVIVRDRKSTRLNSSHNRESRMPSSA